MGKVLRVFKINILALLATLLFVPATAAKLLAKALEKIFAIIGIIFGVMGIIAIFEAIKDTNMLLEGIAMLIVALMLGGIFVVLLIWIITFISSICVSLLQLLITLLEVLYRFIYSGYASLYNICKADYARVCVGANPVLMGLCCIFFTLLRVINRVVIFVVSQAVKVAAALSLFLVGNTLYTAQRIAQNTYGLNYWEYMARFPVSDIIFGVILYLVVIGGIVVIILALGVEWSEWGLEMDVATADYERYKEILSGVGETAQFEAIEDTDDKDYERCVEYNDILNDHVQDFELFCQGVQPVAMESDDMLLREHYNDYVNTITEVAGKLSNCDNISVKEFLKLIPRIKEMELLKKDIQKRVARGMTEKKKAEENLFFAGCDTKEKVEKRYKALCKTYHPDGGAGDEETFKKMQAEYERKQKEF